MKTSIKLTHAIAAVVGTIMMSGSVFAASTVVGSKHDMTGGGQISVTGVSQVCVFCHTPHGSNTSADAPLWNKALPSSGTYTRYSSLGTATLDGEEIAVGSVSLACLSCHDGSQAMDAVINSPGTGGINTAGANLGLGTAMSNAPAPMLGTDLRNDHPISIEYAGGACTNVTTSTCTPSAGAAGTDKDFNPVAYKTMNGTSQWWVDVVNTGTRDKTDMILYTRSFTNGTGPSVECASCHDPHRTDTTPVNFLRIDNSSTAGGAVSGVCLACHAK